MMSKSEIDQWIAQRCPPKYILNVDGRLTVDAQLAIYLKRFVEEQCDGNVTTDNLDAAVWAFEHGLALQKRPKKVQNDEPVFFKYSFKDSKTGETAPALSTLKPVAQPSMKEPDREVKCSNCGSPVSPERWNKLKNAPSWCDVCQSMYSAVASQQGLHNAHDEWELENRRRIKAKQQMLRD